MGSVPWGLLEVIAAGCGPVVKLWAPTEPQQAVKINEGTPVYCLDFSHNNRVLAVAGEKGQANLYSGKGAAVDTGCSQVGTIPRALTETADSVTCIKFAPNDGYIVGGCRNGRVHIWSLKDETDFHAEPLHGSITSVAVNPALTALAASSSAGQVLLLRYPTGQKYKTLMSQGARAGCLGFAPSNPSLLCAAKGSGQLLVWDLNNTAQGYEEISVHRAIVTGCSFAPNDANLLISCGEDGLLACTDRRSKQVAWESPLRQPLSSVSMRWDGTMVAVGTGAGRVLVHDTRRISTTLAVQEFSDELPVTALCWQHMPSSKAHKSGRNSMGAASAAAAPTPGSSSSNGVATAAAAAVPSSSSQAASGSGPGSLASMGAAAAPAAAVGRGPPTAGAGPARTGAVGAASTGPAGAAATAPKVPLVVPGWDSGAKSAASSSSDADAGARVISPVRGYGSPLDSDFNSAGLLGAAGAGGGTAAAAQQAAAAAAGGGFHTPEVGHTGLDTPADSSAPGPGGYRGPAMFTPGLGFMGHVNSAGPVTPFAGPTADVTPVSRYVRQSAAGAAAAGDVEAYHERRMSAVAAAAAAGSTAAAESKGTATGQHASQADVPAAGAAAAAGRAVGSRANASTAAAGTGTGATAAGSGRSSRPSGGGLGISTALTVGATSTSAAAAGTSSRSARPSTAGDSSTADASLSDAAVAAADGSVVVVAARGSSGISSSGKVAAVDAEATAAGQQHIYSSAAAGATLAAGPQGATGVSSSSNGTMAAAGVSGVTGATLREDVFKAYVDARMNALQEAVTSLHADMQRQFAQSQADLAVAMNSLAARQDQLAEAITQLTTAVQHMGAGKQHQQYQSGVAVIPWI